MVYGEAIGAGRPAGAGTWAGEAQRVRLLAAELGLILDEKALAYYDIRDVMSLGLRLQHALCGAGWRSWAIARWAYSVPVLGRLFARLNRRLRPVRV